MEREGLKEGVDRRVVNLQRPASSYFTPQKKPTIIEKRSTIRKTKYQHATPLKRKNDLRTEPDISSHHSAIESPAKRRKTKFLNLIKYWDGEKGEGGDGATQYVNTPLTANLNVSRSKIIIQNTVQTEKLAESKLSQLVGGGMKSESGRQADMDLEGEG